MVQKIERMNSSRHDVVLFVITIHYIRVLGACSAKKPLSRHGVPMQDRWTARRPERHVPLKRGRRFQALRSPQHEGRYRSMSIQSMLKPIQGVPGIYLRW